MGITKIMVSIAVLGLAISVTQASPAQPGGDRRPYPGASPGPGGGAKRQLPGAPDGPGGQARPDGAKGGPGGPGPLGSADPGAQGRRVAELKQKESAGTLTKEEQAELEKLKLHRHKGNRRAERAARLAELKQKEANGELTDAEKQEVDQIQKVRDRHAKLKLEYEQGNQSRAERRRAARRKAVEELPRLPGDQAAIAEFGKHGMRMAKLERAREVAVAEGLDELVTRIDGLMAKERGRHGQWVSKHQGGK